MLQLSIYEPISALLYHLHARSQLDHAGFTVTQSHDIQREIWQKYIFVASMSGITTLMGASVRAILTTPESRTIYEKLLHEIFRIRRCTL
ncbi:ketopantoate reductase family protein [Paenibacillus brasilensis]|uniref:ketopantoate reductase family protein n=1 Tax=Paenibacillus brasilensis TaxID=128574 RepID=UPI0027D8BE44|nr:ketopantoate reductase C-terminal domain-containing protein [Paenibacillus brasilensis]